MKLQVRGELPLCTSYLLKQHLKRIFWKYFTEMFFEMLWVICTDCLENLDNSKGSYCCSLSLQVFTTYCLYYKYLIIKISSAFFILNVFIVRPIAIKVCKKQNNNNNLRSFRSIWLKICLALWIRMLLNLPGNERCTRTLSNNYDGTYLKKRSTNKSIQLFFHKKLHRKCLTGF